MKVMPKLISRQTALRLGLRHYFTGRACRHGHIAERFTSTADCTVCSCKRAADYYSRNPQKMAARARKRYWQNPEAILTRQRARYWSDPEAAREKQRNKPSGKLHRVSG